MVLARQLPFSLTLSKDMVTVERSSTARQLGIKQNNEKREPVPTKDIHRKQREQNHMVGKHFSVTYHNHTEDRRPTSINANTQNNKEHLKVRCDLIFTSVYNQPFL